MNRGLIVKIIHEVWPVTLLFGLGVGLFEFLLATIIPSFLMDVSETLLNIRWLQVILRGLFGTEVGGSLGPQMIASFAWIHPVLLTMLWAQEISLLTRMPAGEVDCGTIDVLLGLPLTRRSILVGETVVWLGTGLVLMLMGVLGNTVGGQLADPEFRHSPGRLAGVVLNLYCLYVAVGGMAVLVTSFCDRRGRAVGLCLAMVLASFILHFLAQFGGLAERLVFLSVLHYYRPLAVVLDGSWPVGDMIVLALIGVVFWFAGAVVFTRRDICTV